MSTPARPWIRGWRFGLVALACLSVGGPLPVVRAAPPPMILVTGLVSQAGEASIKGRVIWGGESAPDVKPLREKGKAEKDPGVCASEKDIPNNQLAVDAKTKGIKFAIAYIVKPQVSNSGAVKALIEKAPSVEIDQKNCEFLPFATAIHQDQSVVFKSSDPVNHNIHLSPFANAPFNTVLAPNGQITKTFVAENRPIPLSCDIHPWMKGYIMVFKHPFFAVSGDDGSFEIKGLPPGDYKLVVWHHFGYLNPGFAQGMPVSVSADGAQVTVNLDPARVK